MINKYTTQNGEQPLNWCSKKTRIMENQESAENDHKLDPGNHSEMNLSSLLWLPASEASGQHRWRCFQILLSSVGSLQTFLDQDV